MTNYIEEDVPMQFHEINLASIHMTMSGTKVFLYAVYAQDAAANVNKSTNK